MNKVLLGAVSVSLLALAACNGTASVTPDTDMDSSASSAMIMDDSSSVMMDDSSATSSDASSVEGMAASAAASVSIEVETH